MASIDLSPVPLGMRDMFLLMSSPHVIGLSYHRWLDLAAIFSSRDFYHILNG